VDRLDTWLNAQRGWRRLGLLWLQTFPASILVVNAYLGWRGLSDSQPAGTEWVWLVALAVPCTTVLAGVVLLLRPGSERRAGSRGRFVQPLFSWRGTGFILLLASSKVADVYVTSAPYDWKQRHHALSAILMVLIIGACVLGFENFRYIRRMRRLAAAAAPGQGGIGGGQSPRAVR
jgi:hypothetical protein